MEGLGPRIRSIRKSRRMTLVELAEKTGIDQATLSRIENSRMIGTLSSHMKIAEVLTVPLPQLYEDAIKKIHESRDNAARQKFESLPHAKGVVSELLTTGIHQKKMIPLLIKMRGRGFSENERHSDIAERFVYVLKGAVEVTVQKEKQLLKTGDHLYFNAGLSHSFRNALKSEAQILSVLTPTAV